VGALALVLCAQLMVILDMTIVNVALPSIERGLHFSATSLSWVLNAYALTFGGLLLLGGRATSWAGAGSSSPASRCSRWRRWPPAWPPHPPG
jgi:MFS family permease